MLTQVGPVEMEGGKERKNVNIFILNFLVGPEKRN